MGNVLGGNHHHAQSSSNGDKFSDLRQEADQLFQQRRELGQQSQDAWQRGDRHKAKMLSDQAKQIGRRAQAAQAQASQAIYQQSNAKRTDGMIDLHGLYVAEAEERAERALIDAKHNGASSVVFIVGQGLHSKDGIAKLRPAVERLIAKHNLRCIPDSPNVGCLLVQFVREEERGWVGNLLHHIGCVVMDKERGWVGDLLHRKAYRLLGYIEEVSKWSCTSDAIRRK